MLLVCWCASCSLLAHKQASTLEALTFLLREKEEIFLFLFVCTRHHHFLFNSIQFFFGGHKPAHAQLGFDCSIREWEASTKVSPNRRKNWLFIPFFLDITHSSGLCNFILAFSNGFFGIFRVVSCYCDFWLLPLLTLVLIVSEFCGILLAYFYTFGITFYFFLVWWWRRKLNQFAGNLIRFQHFFSGSLVSPVKHFFDMFDLFERTFQVIFADIIWHLHHRANSFSEMMKTWQKWKSAQVWSAQMIDH